MPKPGDARQQCVVDAIYSLLLSTGAWPTFARLDKYLDGRGEAHVDIVMEGMPSELLYGRNSGSRPQPMQEVALTIAGLNACPAAAEDVRVFMEAMQLAVTLEAEWFPDDTTADHGPMLTPDTVVRRVALPAAGRDETLRRLGLILGVERWAWSASGTGASPGDWHFTVDRRVRALRGTPDIDFYWQVAHAPEPAPQLTWPSPEVSLQSSPNAPAHSWMDYLNRRIRAVAEPRLHAGYGDSAVEESWKVVAERLRKLTGLSLDGVDLVNQSLGDKGPLEIGDRTTPAGRDDQQGHADLLRGLVRVGRNPRAHECATSDYDEVAVVRLLLLASLCLDRLEAVDDTGRSV
jgi:uncharacterized protein (TIGR02391 family)